MSKNLKKILVTGASLLILASVSSGASQMVQPIHAEAYTQERTGTLTHSVRFGRHFYRKGSPVYGAQSLGNPTKMYVYLGNDTVDQRLIPDRYYTNAMHLHHHHHYRHHAKALYQIRPHYSTKTYNRLFKRLVHEMKAHGMHYDSSNETGKLNHKGRMIELTGTNTGVVTNGGPMGIKPLWPDQALTLLHKMYRHTAHHYYRPVRRHRTRKPRRAKAARKATKKHARKLSKKSTKHARKHFVAAKKHIAKKAHHTMLRTKVTKKAPKNTSKAYKKGFALGNYANSTPGDDTGSSKEAVALMSTPFNSSSAKGFMTNATKQFRHGLGLAFGKKMSQKYNNQAKSSATNAMNAWKLIWQNRNNPKFLMGMKANLGAYSGNEAVYMDPSMRQYQNDSSFKAGYLAGDDFTDGFSANNLQNDKMYSNYVNDYNPALNQHYNY